MKRHAILVISLLVTLSYSCEYEPTEEYNRNVNTNVIPPQIQVVELNLNDDSIYLYNDKEVVFSFSSDNQKILAVSYLIDGTEKLIVHSESGKFTINCNELSEGIHSLTMKIYTNSGTGSIADHIEAEGYEISKSWVLTIDKSYFPQMQSAINNGLLSLQWTEYLATNFKEYIIYKNGKEIKRIQTNEFIDSTYVGENSEYSVQVHTEDNSVFNSGAVYLDTDLPMIHFSVEDSNKYVIHWNKSKYYNAIDSYAIFQSPRTSGDFTLIKTIQNPDDTLFTLTSVCFGDEIDVKIRIVPKSTNSEFLPSNYYNFESGTYGGCGYDVPCRQDLTNLCKIKNDEIAFIDYCDSLVKYSVSQRKIMQKLGYESTTCSTCNFHSLQGSPQGKYLIANVGCDDEVMLTIGDNIKDFSIYKSQDIPGDPFSRNSISDMGTSLYRSWDGGLYVYDFINSATLGYYKKSNTIYDPNNVKISSEGDYFFAIDDSLRLVHFAFSQFEDIWVTTKTNNLKFYEFDALNPSRVVFWDGSKFSVKQCADLSIVYEFTLNRTAILDIDYYNNEILAYSKGHLYVHSLVNGSLISNIPISFEPDSWMDECYLLNHTIVYTKGLLYSINQ